MAERGLSLAHTTIMRSGFNAMRPNSRETLEPLRSASWTVLARRRDLRQNQRTLDLSLPCRRQRGKNASTSCCAPSGTSPRPRPSSGLLSGVRDDCTPLKVTLDGYQASHRAAKEALDRHPEEINARLDHPKYLDNLIEQDHRSRQKASAPVKSLRPQAFPPSHQRRSPASNLCIGSGRVSSNSVDWAQRETQLPKIWNAVLAAA